MKRYNEWVSLYQRDHQYDWVGTHRLPMSYAVMVAKHIKSAHPTSMLAIVPDSSDPKPVLKFVEELHAA